MERPVEDVRSHWKTEQGRESYGNRDWLGEAGVRSMDCFQLAPDAGFPSQGWAHHHRAPWDSQRKGHILISSLGRAQGDGTVEILQSHAHPPGSITGLAC